MALGGYGRRLLTPASDVDLMVLHRERRAERVREAAERLFYPFWDAGIPLGHAVRTVAECVAEAARALEVACSLLDARVLAGDAALVADLERRLLSRLRRDPAGFAAKVGDDAAARHGRHPSCATSLEPDLKEGAGGLRDANAVGWLERVADEPLVDETRRAELDAAEEFFVRARSGLRLLTGKRGDVVLRERQPDLAPALGYDATAGLQAEDALMRAVFDHGRRVRRALDDALRAALGEAGAPTVPQPLRRAAGEGWTAEARTAFVEILADGAGPAFDRMDLDGTLVRILPEWEPVRCRPQRDPYHRSPVDVHLVAAATVAAEILRGGHRDDPLLAASAEAVRDHDAVLLGALLHDIGKRGEGRHVEVGERVAASVLERMGVGGATRDDALFLVREHLLLSETATRRDLADRDLVLGVAARIGDLDRLAMLHVLTVADAEATGPHAATPWRQELVRELVAKVEHVLLRGEMDRERAADLAARRGAIRDLLAAADTAAVEAYLQRVPTSYLLEVPAETAAAHYRLLAPPLAASEVRTAAEPGRRRGTWQLTVVATDRRGLLARIAGSLALSGLSILSAQAFTTADGVALDLFDVVPAFEGDVDEERWRSVRQTLRKALEGRISLEYRVLEKRRHYPAPPHQVATDVRVLNDESDFATVVEVEAADRLGLLFDLARAFEELRLDVSLAKVGTYGPRVVDVFYVTDAGGAKVHDPDVAREIERSIRSRLEA